MAVKFKPCSVSGCNGNASPTYAQGSKGYCNAHYNRWRRHGEPNGGRTLVGEPMQYYQDVVLAYDGDECLPWPYSHSAGGYGQLLIGGRLQVVSRVVCETVHGPPPTPKHDAAHSCGKGHLACVTKGHLSWKTRKENNADKIIHGTNTRSKKHEIAALCSKRTKRATTRRREGTVS